MNMDVIYEDNHLLVLNKPAGIATMGAEDGVPTLHCNACEYIRKKYQKPGKVFLGVVSRLDTVTSGVIVFARTSKSASRLTPQFAKPAAADMGHGANEIDRGGKKRSGKQKTVRAVEKIYLAAVRGSMGRSTDVLDDHVIKDDSARRMRCVDPSVFGSQPASLRYVVVEENDDLSLLAIRLLTGRKHQVRNQFSSRGFPILGDRKYGSQDSFPSGIALHSWSLRLDHPTRQERMYFHANLPQSWTKKRLVRSSATDSAALLSRVSLREKIEAIEADL